ncbi:MAG: hypothetical protein KGR98_12785, partial [Verrucomicrobia bacterium]|nr:hypothetical protein [Verrucomicrobiota bacterium]
VDNYAGRMAELAHQHGLQLSIEAYGGPCDDLPYAGQADEPMCEFWTGGGMFQTVKEMASAAHVYGKPVLGAESFTSDSRERWLDYPATIKALGDEAFCGGVQRFVFHRYALQPWKREYRPGMTMGPWGLHYERTETWWNWTPAWHRYLARCQYLLRQGRFVADLCYLRPEAAPQGAHPQHPKGYDYDECSADVVLRDMTVKDGRLVLPDGMSYRLLVLSEERAMTPPLLRKITQLVQAGATVVGPRPLRSPSLSDYPECDEVVKQLGRALWGDCDGESVFEHRFGQGRVVWGIPVEKILAAAGVPPDFTSQPPLNYIHRRADGADIYFVANGEPYTVSARCRFRVGGEQPEFWWPATGRTESAAAWKTGGMVTTLPLRLGPSGSVFVLFREPAGHYDPIVTATRDGKSIWPAASQAPQITIEKAAYGVLSDPKRTRDVRPKVQHLVDAGEYRFRVAQMARGDDPAYGIVKTLVVRYTVAGRQLTATGTDPETMDLAQSPAPHGLYGPQLHRTPDGRLYLETGQPGRYVFKTASGKTHQIDVPALPSPLKIYGPWKVRFAPHEGAPARVTFDHLISWSQSTNSGVKYFSGTAAYSRTFNVPRDLIGRQRRLYLDLGRVEVMARVELNGHDLGVLWKPPYRVDITRAIRAGRN